MDAQSILTIAILVQITFCFQLALPSQPPCLLSLGERHPHSGGCSSSLEKQTPVKSIQMRNKPRLETVELNNLEKGWAHAFFSCGSKIWLEPYVV